MNLSLRTKLRLPENCSDKELQDACNRYYAIYTGILEASVANSTKAIATDKLGDLCKSAEQEGILLKESPDFSFKSHSVNTNASVEEELSQVSGSLSQDKINKLNNMLSALPSSAKRHYLSALVLLYGDPVIPDSYRDAWNKLKSACDEDPENIVYQATLDDLSKEINAYNTELYKWQTERKAESERQRRIALAKRIFKGIGTALLWIGGIFFVIAGQIFSCICSSCDCC